MSCINNSGNINETFIIEAQQIVSADTFVTGFTLSSNNLILSQNRTDEYSAFTVNLYGTLGGAYLALSGGTVTGGTSFISGLTATSLNLTSVANSAPDAKVLSIDSTGKVNFVYKSAITVSSSANTFTTGATYSVSSGILTFKRNDGVEYSAGTFNYITGSTQSGNTLTLTSNSGASFTYTPSVLTGSFLPLSGGTVSGNTVFTSGLTANIISATTYLNLPVSTDTVISSFTYTSSANTFTISDSRNSAFTATLTSVSGLTVNGSLSATTISGGTFYGNGSNLTGIKNIYTSDGTIESNRVVTISGNTLAFNSIRTGGTAMQLSVAQTQANASDTGDVAFSLGYTLSGNNLGTELVTRVFALSTINQSTGTTVSNMRIFNLAMNTLPDTSTDELVGVYIENGTAQGSVSNGRGVYLNNGLIGTNQVGFNVKTLNGDNNTGLLLFEENIPTGNWGVYARTHKNYFENNVLIGSDTDSGYQLDVTGRAKISYLSTAFTDSPLIVKNTDPSAFVSNAISFDCDATGIDQPIFMNFAGPNPKGFGFYASSNPITATPDGAAFQMYNISAGTFPGQVFFDSGAHDNAAIRFRTAPTSGFITERMRITSDGKVGIGTTTPNTILHVLRGSSGSMDVGYYEAASIQNSGDTKFGVYTNVSQINDGGSSIVLGYSNLTDNVGYYPGFEFQHSGSLDSASNFVRYNFLERSSNGQVSGGVADLFNIFADGRIVMSGTPFGVFPSTVDPKLGINVSNPVTSLDVRGGAHIGSGTPTTYAGNLHTLEITSAGVAAPLSLIGGSGTVEIWIDNPPPYTLPTKAVMFGAAAPGTPADGDFHFSTFNQPTNWSDRIIIKNDTGFVGIATSSITNTLHVSASTNPLRLEGLTSNTSNNLILSVDSFGVVHTYPISGLTGGSTTVSGNYLPLSGGTVTGGTIFSSGLSASTISATTYQNLPVTADTFVTGFTLSSNTITLSQNRTGQFSAFTISLSAYTGTSSVSGAFLPLSGGTVFGSVFFTSAFTTNLLTVTGNTRLASVTANTLNVTGNTTLSTLTGTSLTLTSLTGTTDRFVQVNSGGTVSASINIVSAYIPSASTAATLLSNGSNWNIYGVYTGTAISGTSMGQKHYDDNYFYEAVADNTFIRLIRG